MTLALVGEGVENPANVARIADAAALLAAGSERPPDGRLIALENAPGAKDVYGRRPLRDDATLVVGNERRGLSRGALEAAHETLVIPTLSRTVRTLNVAAAAAVGGWYVLRGSGAQARMSRPDSRRPALLLVGDDHVEVGSSLRSAAAFGFSEVLLEDRGAGWFEGPSHVRRESRAAARRHKNPLRVRRASVREASRYERVLLVTPCGDGMPLQRQRVARGSRQLVVVGARAEELAEHAGDRLELASLGLAADAFPHLRLVASIALAEVARQVGRGKRAPAPVPRRPPRYELAAELTGDGETILVDPARLLDY